MAVTAAGVAAVAAGASKIAAQVSPYVTGALSYKHAKNMANTAHQREVNDLRAAGLNPILSAGAGGGASVPEMHIENPQAMESMSDVLNKKEQRNTAQIDQSMKISAMEQSDAQSRLLDKQRDILQFDLDNKPAAIAAQNKLAQMQLEKLAEEKKLTTAMEKKTNSERNATNYDNFQRAANAEIYKGEKGKYISGIEKLIQTIRGH